MLSPDAPMSYAEVLHKSVPRFIVVGPEGGFTQREIDHAVRNGASLVRLGRTILRAETAALAALAAIVACDSTAWTT